MWSRCGGAFPAECIVDEARCVPTITRQPRPKAVGCGKKLDSAVARDSSDISEKSKPKFDLRNEFLLALRQAACAIGWVNNSWPSSINCRAVGIVLSVRTQKGSQLAD
jgi:hypothetical protein